MNTTDHWEISSFKFIRFNSNQWNQLTLDDVNKGEATQTV